MRKTTVFMFVTRQTDYFDELELYHRAVKLWMLIKRTISSILIQLVFPFAEVNFHSTYMNSSYSLSVGDNDNQNGWDAADNDDHCQGQQCSLCVAHSLHSFFYTSHHFRGSDLQNPSTGREKRLELLIDVQEFTIKKP